MKIAFLGNFSAQYSSENGHKLSLERLGHEVIPFQERSATAMDILNCPNIDMFIWVKTHSWHTANMVDALEILKSRNVPTVSFHLDLYLGLEREHEINEDYFKIEHFFTVDKLMAEHLSTHTKTKGHYLPPACLEEDAFIGTPNKEKYPHDVVFTGNYFYHKEWSYRQKLIDWLKATYGNRFAHYGGGGLPTTRGVELNNIYASAKVVIGDTLCKNFDYKWYFSDRLPEVISRGGFMIFPYIHGLENMFEIGKEIVTYKFDDFGQLKFLIDYFISDEGAADRERIRLAGHERAKKEHLYKHRWETILKTVFL